jgi:hypothetical protein
VSYSESLSEMNDGQKFYYSNSTQTKPVNAKTLTKIAGVGNSPVINYTGTGAYFLDKVEDGVWRLELMPDAIPVRDPFEKASPKKEVTAIEWRKNKMQIDLDDLGKGFSVKALNEGNNFSEGVLADSFQIGPGTYLLTSNGKTFSNSKNKIGVIGLNEFVAPPSSNTEITVRHEALTEVSAGKTFTIHATVGGIDTGRVSVQLTKLGGGLFRNIPMKRSGFDYTAEVPADIVMPGQLQYRIIAREGNVFSVYPGNIKTDPFAWDNYQFETYKTNVASENSSLELYDPSVDRTVSVLPNFRRGFQTAYGSGENSGHLVFKLSITDMQADEVMGFQHYVGDKLKQRSAELNSFDKIVVRAKTASTQPINIKLILVNKNGAAFSATCTLSADFQDVEVPLSNFKTDAALLIPRPYPGFQPLYFKSSANNEIFKPGDIEKIQVTTSPSLQSSNSKSYNFEIESVKLTKRK